jgi:uncharacterized membrane protein (DUF106 family)
LASVGIGVSMIGGLLSSLGLEETGEVITTIGSAITLVGGALMAIPPILTVITMHPIIAIITAIAAVVVALIATIASFIKNNSMEARVEKAAKATEDAKKVAQET